MNALEAGLTLLFWDHSQHDRAFFRMLLVIVTVAGQQCGCISKFPKKVMWEGLSVSKPHGDFMTGLLHGIPITIAILICLLSISNTIPER